MFTSPMQIPPKPAPSLHLWGLGARRLPGLWKKGLSWPWRSGGSQPPQAQPPPAGLLGRGHRQHGRVATRPCPEKRSWQKRLFSKERVAARLISVLQDGPSTGWLHPKMWVGAWDPRTRDELGPPGPAKSPGTGVKLTPAPPKAELSPGKEGDVALSLCLGLKDGAPSGLSLATDLPRGPWDPSWAQGHA